MFLQIEMSLGALLIWKGYAPNLGLQPCVYVCMSMCARACFYLSAAGHTLMVCVASVVSIPVRSWLKESKSDRASHSDLRPASEGNTKPSNFASIYETDGFGMWPHNSSTRGWGCPSVFSVSVCLMIGCCIYSSLLTKLLPIFPAAIWKRKVTCGHSLCYLLPNHANLH